MVGQAPSSQPNVGSRRLNTPPRRPHTTSTIARMEGRVSQRSSSSSAAVSWASSPTTAASPVKRRNARSSSPAPGGPADGGRSARTDTPPPSEAVPAAASPSSSACAFSQSLNSRASGESAPTRASKLPLQRNTKAHSRLLNICGFPVNEPGITLRPASDKQGRDFVRHCPQQLFGEGVALPRRIDRCVQGALWDAAYCGEGASYNSIS